MVNTNSSCQEFMEGIAACQPTPGGGSVAALVGSFGAALGNMVAAYTVNKKKYADVQDDMEAYIAELNEIQAKLIELVQGDMDAFEPLAALYKEKSSDPEEMAKIREKKQMALYTACRIPMEIINQCGRAIELDTEVVHKGNKLVISDAGAGAVICKAAIEAASISVYINTSSFEDREFADKINRECVEKTMHYGKMADRVFEVATKKFMTTQIVR